MKYIITESQNKRIKFTRRVGVSPKMYVMDLVYERSPCYSSFERFISALIEDSLFSWMSEEDMDYMTDFIQGDLWNELKDYYDERCGQ